MRCFQDIPFIIAPIVCLETLNKSAILYCEILFAYIFLIISISFSFNLHVLTLIPLALLALLLINISLTLSFCVPNTKWFRFIHAGVSHLWHITILLGILPLKYSHITLCVLCNFLSNVVRPYPHSSSEPIQIRQPSSVNIDFLSILNKWSLYLIFILSNYHIGDLK